MTVRNRASPDYRARRGDVFGGVAEFRDIHLACPALPSAVVLGNQHHLRQVIYNLFDNALKFTPAGGRVTVQLRVDAEATVFSVRDSGVGIPPQELPHVFDRFFQGHRPKTGPSEKRGTGLGLSICQAIIQAHDGTIDVDSQVAIGTRFTVRLPRDDSRTDSQSVPSSFAAKQEPTVEVASTPSSAGAATTDGVALRPSTRTRSLPI